MKILFIIPEEFDGARWGGVTTYTVEMSKELQKRGHIVSILTPAKRDNLRTRFGIPIYTISLCIKESRTIRVAFKVLRYIHADIYGRFVWARAVKRFVVTHGPYDVIEAPEWGSSTLCLSHRMGKLVVRTHKSWLMYKQDNALPISIADRITDIFERLCILRASVVTSPTHFMLRQYPWIIYTRALFGMSTVMIPNGISLPSLHKSTHGFSFRPYLLTVGRIEIAKGCAVLAKAFAQIATRHGRLHLVFVGEDTRMYIDGHWVSCIDYIRQSVPIRVQRRMHFISRQTRKSLMKYYEKCLCYVAPSFGHENPSIALIEAISFGRSVIGSDAGGIPEVLQSAHSGIIFREGDSRDLAAQIDYVIRHSSIRRSYERNALLKRGTYDIRSTAAKTEKVYLSNNI